MRKFFLTLAVLVMAIYANAQKNQYFWYQGNLILGNPIAQIDSITFGEEDTDSIMLYLPRTIVKKEIVHDTVIVPFRDTVYLETPSNSINYTCDNIIASGTCGKQGNNVLWTLCSDSVLIFEGHGEMEDYPNYTAPWYSHIEAFHTMIIGEGITVVGEEAGMNAHNLKRLILPKSVKGIDFLAFHGASNLQYVTFPDSLEYIGERSFLDCAMTTVTIPANVHTIGGGAFQGCTKLKSVYTQSATPAGAGYDIFINVTDATIFVPRGSLQAYQNAYGWNEHASQMVEYDYTPKAPEQVVHDTVIVHDTIYIMQPCPVDIPEGALYGAFSVAADKKVLFANGNLQYQASTNTWRFAEKQYNMVGNDNQYISSTYTGWIDLFGWGTGNNPSISTEVNTDYSTFVDWGVNAISNGGNEANMWRTLTKDEWQYMLYTRTNAASLFGLGSVNGVNGAIILPDNWSIPQGASFTPSSTRGLVDEGGYSHNPSYDNFSHNTYTAEQWYVMESAGAVFLPAAGTRNGTQVNIVGELGHFWSSTYINADYAYGLNFDSYDFNPQNGNNRNYGRSVRLVQDVK